MIGLVANTAAEEMWIVALSPVPVEESDVETSFDTAHVLAARETRRSHGRSGSRRRTCFLDDTRLVRQPHHARGVRRG